MHLEKLWALNVGVTTRIVDCCTAPMLMQQVRWPGTLASAMRSWLGHVFQGCKK